MAVAAIVLGATAVAGQALPVNGALEDLLRPGGGRGARIAGYEILAPDLLREFYAERAFYPVWTDDRYVDLLLSALNEAENHGLLPEDVHRQAVVDRVAAADPQGQAERDILMSDAFLRALYLLKFGKVKAATLEHDWNLSRPILNVDPLALLEDALVHGSINRYLLEAKPKSPYYDQLVGKMREYRAIAAAGGWPLVSDGPTLRPGDRGPRVAELRARLNAPAAARQGDPDGDPELYTDELKIAVERFQRFHAIEADGIVGPATLSAMNVSVAERVEQIAANLERARWVEGSLEPDLVAVNIPGFYLRVYRGGALEWETRVVVGKDYHKTPVFFDRIDYLEFNPTWTPPRSIAINEILPKVKRDRAYLDRQHFDVVSGAGARVSPASIDWGAQTANSFPYYFVQRPGIHNALGEVKFMFPNKHAVYLHDTPSKGLFGKTERAFSHGCIRVENPLELAELLLAPQGDWDRARIDRLLATRKTQRVTLETPMQVALFYWTVDPIGKHLVFYPDIYGRDPPLIDALRRPLTTSSI